MRFMGLESGRGEERVNLQGKALQLQLKPLRVQANTKTAERSYPGRYIYFLDFSCRNFWCAETVFRSVHNRADIFVQFPAVRNRGRDKFFRF